MEKNGILQSGESASAPTRGQTTPSNRILVVDDDADIRQVNADVLRRFGYQTETAADGAAAWEALQANCYDLLITDNKMPKLSGVELVKKLRFARMALPVILASGTIPTDELERNPWLQPVATLVKPFLHRQLLATVNEVLA
jgi:CheY-like chemotaxis protein